MAVLEQSPPKVRAPAGPTKNGKDVSPEPRPSRGPEASLYPESQCVPFKAFGKVTAFGGRPTSAVRFVPRGLPWAGPGARAGQGKRRWG